VTSIDIRTQTEYGTLRAYSRAGFQWTTNDDGIGTYYVERTFIQFAGFTFGRSQSYFDFYANAMYYTGYIGGPSSTGAAGMNVLAYTATFGNGFTATLSLEDGTLRRSAMWDAGTDALAIGRASRPVDPDRDRLLWPRSGREHRRLRCGAGSRHRRLAPC
jgi:hypothetical protein